MATSDRMYELTCECRDLEGKYDRLLLDLELAKAVARGAHELLEAIDEDRLSGLLPPLTDRTAGAATALKTLLS